MMFFRRFFATAPQTKVAREVYSLIVAKARQPFFYAKLGVPDTVDGRFDMIALHAFLVIDRLSKGGDKARDLSQRLFDEMFADMDRSLREMGVGDLSVGKKVRTMAEVFYGRAKAYGEPLSKNDIPGLERALARNIFPESFKAASVSALAAYVGAAARLLAELSDMELMAGRLNFPEPESFVSP
jgi:cytochrome b pre-mRNA-processing protein 3